MQVAPRSDSVKMLILACMSAQTELVYVTLVQKSLKQISTKAHSLWFDYDYEVLASCNGSFK